MRPTFMLIWSLLLIWSSASLAAPRSPLGKSGPSSRSDSNRPEKKKAKPQAGLLAAIARDSLTPKEGKNSLTGMSFIGGGVYVPKLSPTLKAPVSAGIRYMNVSYSQNSVSLTLTETFLYFEGGLSFIVAPGVGLGFAFEYDYGMSGSAQVKIADISATETITSFSNLLYGLQFTYDISPKMAVVGGYRLADASTSITDTDEDGNKKSVTTNFNGNELRGGLNIYF